MTETTKQGRNWGRVALVLSLALNLAVLGLVAGAMLHGPRDRDANPALGDLGYGPFVAALPRADRREMGRAMEREAGAFRENRAQMRVMFESFLKALRADPYDPAVVANLVTDQQSKVSERQNLGARLLLERIAAMDALQRATYADALDQALRRGPRPDWRSRRN